MENKNGESRIWLTPREKELLSRRYRQKWEDACERRARAEIAAAEDAAECFAIYQAPEYLAPEDSGIIRRTLRAVGLCEEKLPLPVPEPYPATAEEAKKAMPFLSYLFANVGLRIKCEQIKTEKGTIPWLYVEDEEMERYVKRATRRQESCEYLQTTVELFKESNTPLEKYGKIFDEINAYTSGDGLSNLNELEKFVKALYTERDMPKGFPDNLRDAIEKLRSFLQTEIAALRSGRP